MNEQKPPHGIEWVRLWGRRGFTWNVIGGCAHDCQWIMPSGEVAECYAKSIAEGNWQRKFYPQGFAHHYWHPERLDEPMKMKTPAGIFADSMSDLMGQWVTITQIEQVLDVCRRTPQHIYFLLTKNAPRLKNFDFPPNVWVGVSSPPDKMYGHDLDAGQQVRFLKVALEALAQLRLQGVTTWMSFEPLSWNVAPIVRAHAGALEWSVIGAASSGFKEYPPAEQDVVNLVQVLDMQQTPVFYKGNLRSLPWAVANWREDFPPEPMQNGKPTLKQEVLFD
jgi:protein gp37